MVSTAALVCATLLVGLPTAGAQFCRLQSPQFCSGLQHQMSYNYVTLTVTTLPSGEGRTQRIGFADLDGDGVRLDGLGGHGLHLDTALTGLSAGAGPRSYHWYVW
jgi:hypothetical protein